MGIAMILMDKEDVGCFYEKFRRRESACRLDEEWWSCARRDEVNEDILLSVCTCTVLS